MNYSRHPSPRYSSRGSYMTRVSISDPTTQRFPISTNTELKESTIYLAKIKIMEFLASLPSRGWLGKHIFEAIKDEGESDSVAMKLSERCWMSMIKFDNVGRELGYTALTSSLEQELQMRHIELLEPCWSKCVRVLERSATDLISMNPAYIRSSSFTLQRFVTLSITHSFLDSSSRHQWTRALNLIDHWVRSAERFLPGSLGQ